MSFDYQAEKEDRYKKKIEELLPELPPFFREVAEWPQRNRSYATVYSYMARARTFFRHASAIRNEPGKGSADWTPEDLDAMEPWDIMEVIESACGGGEPSESTVNAYLVALGYLWDVMIRLRKIRYNPVALVNRRQDMRKEKKEALTGESAELLIWSAENGTGLSPRQEYARNINGARDVALCRLLAEGVRVTDAAALDVDDISFAEGVVYIERGRGRKEKIRLGEDALDALKEYVWEWRETYHPDGEERAVFLSGVGCNRGRRLSIRSIQKTVKKYGRSAGLGDGITPRKLTKNSGLEY